MEDIGRSTTKLHCRQSTMYSLHMASADRQHFFGSDFHAFGNDDANGNADGIA